MTRFPRRLRLLHRLVSDVCSLGSDPHAWPDRLATGLAELFEARMIGLAWARLPDGPGEFNRAEVQLHHGFTPEEDRDYRRSYIGDDGVFRSEFLRRVVNIPARFVTVRRQDVMSDDEWYAQPEIGSLHRRLNIDANMASFFVVVGQRRLFGIGVHRAWGEPQFTTENRRELRVIHVEIARNWRKRLVVPREGTAAVARLPLRLRQVLWLLCLGRSEKEVASHLDLSVHTVHNHVRRLHTLLGVHSRGELLAQVLTPLDPTALVVPGSEDYLKVGLEAIGKRAGHGSR